MKAQRDAAFERISAEMRKRFDENVWRDDIAFPSLEELTLRAHNNCARVYSHLAAGSDAAALCCAADAANLLALAVQHYSDRECPPHD